MSDPRRSRSRRSVSPENGLFGGTPDDVEGDEHMQDVQGGEWRELAPSKTPEQWWYTGKEFKKFANHPPARSKNWAAWAFLSFDENPSGLLYEDNRGQWELYVLDVWTDPAHNAITVPVLFENATNVPFRGHVIAISSNTLNSLPSIAAARACLSKLVEHPTMEMLQTMADALEQHDSTKVCKQMRSKKIVVQPKINGVRVTTVGVHSRTLPDFIDTPPTMTDTEWMQWGHYSEKPIYIYKDKEKFEVYYTGDYEKEGSELVGQIYDASFNVEGVELIGNIQLKRLQIARTCLYKYKKNTNDASLEELQDMVARLGKARIDDELCLEMYGQKSKAKQSEWFWQPAKGTPILPRFYFNPKPLRAGPATNSSDYTRQVLQLQDIKRSK